MKKLSELEKGIKAKIVRVENDDIYLKLIEMGFLPDEELLIENIAPLGDPICVCVNGNSICLRLDEADKIIVE